MKADENSWAVLEYILLNCSGASSPLMGNPLEHRSIAAVAQESPFVDVALSVAEKLFCRPIRVVRGAPLLYEITVNNSLEVMTQEQIRHPKRGASAFQTDLCILEEKSPDVTIPRVVLEFKTKITTHDILTYSAKATKHKQIYPYLRYGIIASEERKVPRRFFTHNDGLDFFVSVAGLDGHSFEKFLEKFLVAEIASSQRLEEIAFGSTETRVFRNEVDLW